MRHVALPEGVTPEWFTKFLEEYNVPVSKWRKKPEEFLGAVAVGERALFLVPMFTARVVRLKVTAGDLRLVEVKQVLPGGKVRTRDEAYWPSETLRGDEHPKEGLSRLIAEEFPPKFSEIAPFCRELPETVEFKESQNYPGLPGRYTFYNYECELPPDSRLVVPFEHPDKDKVLHFEWKPI